MKKIKRKYLHPKLLLYKYTGCLENSLSASDMSRARNIILTKHQNEVSTLTFTIPFTKDRKISYDDCEKLVKYENDYYIIKSIDVSDNDTKDMKITCEREDYELKGKYCEPVNEIGQTPQHMFETIMNAVKTPIKKDLYKWGGTDVVNKYRHLITEDEASIYENFISMSQVFNGWIEIITDDNGQKWVYLKTKYKNKGRKLKKNLDMKTLGITYDSSEIFTQLYLEGAPDEVTGNPITIMSVNPNGKSYLENYSWYLAKGIPTEVVDAEPKYQQLKKLCDDTYINPRDLYELGLEEIEKCSKPQLTATLTMRDLSAYMDSLDDELDIGDEILCIDKDIDFVFSCQVVGIEKNFENPLETKITIQNFIRYDTTFQNINHTIDVVKDITNNNPFDTEGNIKGDGKPYIDMNKIKDGDHWNQLWTNQQFQSLATQTYDNISLRVEELEKSYAEINITTDSIISTVASMEDNLEQSKTEIAQFSDRIDIKASKGEMGSLIEINPEAVMLSWNQNNKYCMVDDDEGLCLGDRDGDSYSKLGYDGRIALKTSSMLKPYHCLSFTGFEQNLLYEESQAVNNGYCVTRVPIPPLFDGIDTYDMIVSCSIAKFNLDGYYLPYWMGAYAYIDHDSRDILIYYLSAWRRVSTTTVVSDVSSDDEGGIDCDYETVLGSLSSPVGGYINIQYNIIA